MPASSSKASHIGSSNCAWRRGASSPRTSKLAPDSNAAEHDSVDVSIARMFIATIVARGVAAIADSGPTTHLHSARRTVCVARQVIASGALTPGEWLAVSFPVASSRLRKIFFDRI